MDCRPWAGSPRQRGSVDAMLVQTPAGSVMMNDYPALLFKPGGSRQAFAAARSCT
jgi:hypothetical protein